LGLLSFGCAPDECPNAGCEDLAHHFCSCRHQPWWSKHGGLTLHSASIFCPPPYLGPDKDGLHHRWLFEYRGYDRPENCIPVVTGSAEEQALIQRLLDFLQRPVFPPFADPTPGDYHIECLQEMLHYILRREPCFTADLREAGFIGFSE